MSELTLESTWRANRNGAGHYGFRLPNTTGRVLQNFTLCLTSQNYPTRPDRLRGAQILRSDGSFLEIAPPNGVVLTPGESWEFTLHNPFFTPVNDSDGPLSAYLVLQDGQFLDLRCLPLQRVPQPEPCKGTAVPSPAVDPALAVMPWPNDLTLTGTTVAPSSYHCDAGPVQMVVELLFGDQPPVFSRDKAGRTVTFSQSADLACEAYQINFAPDAIQITHGTAGRTYALVTLAQILLSCRQPGAATRFPAPGSRIADAPCHGWRGAMLDVARQFFSVNEIKRFLATLAWYKFNTFHWHLSDDEAWRLEIRALPELTATGARRGHGLPLAPQLGDGPEGQEGFYTQDQVRDLVAFAGSLNIRVLPELDMPGHCTAVLRALPHLADPQEPAKSYASVQNFANNCLNPAVPGTDAFIDTVLGEMAELFPGDVWHIGGDEVPEGAWKNSPLARAAMARSGQAPQALFGQFIAAMQARLDALGKRTGIWDEGAEACETERSRALIFLWRDAHQGLTLAENGFDVIMSPAEHYYLDIRQSEYWDAPGAGWAGVTPLPKTYDYVPPGHAGILGVQCAIWTEKMKDRAVFDALVFPRLQAVAEGAWTRPENKDWPRFQSMLSCAHVVTSLELCPKVGDGLIMRHF